jgi:nucleolar complex protein 2
VPTKAAGWSSFRPVVKAFCTHLVHFIDQLSEPKLLSFVLQNLQAMHRFAAPFPKLTKKLLKKLLDLWGSASETVRILAFMNIRQMALDIPFPFIERCLKVRSTTNYFLRHEKSNSLDFFVLVQGIYLTFVRNAKFMNAQSRPIITFMCNCVVELYGIDFVSSYQHAFVYIRQLAVHLNNAANTKNKVRDHLPYSTYDAPLPKRTLRVSTALLLPGFDPRYSQWAVVLMVREINDSW